MTPGAWGALLVLLVWMFCLPVNAHSFYSPECCSDRDCAPIPRDARVRVVQGGYEVTMIPGTTPIFFSQEKVRPSQDGQYHTCIGPNGYVYCLYVPSGV